MKGKTENYHLIINPKESADIQLGSSVTVRSDCEKMLGVEFHYKLNFDKDMKTLCIKANNRLRTFARTTPYMSVSKKKILINSFFKTSLTTAHLYGCYTSVDNNIISNLHA